MFRKLIASLILVTFVLMLAGCAAHIHQVGKGAQGTNVEEQRQWYALWGLIPLNEVDSHEMAGDAKDYTVTTQMSEIDVVLNIFTEWISVVSRTVTVEK